jgi:hypothetical protein
MLFEQLPRNTSGSTPGGGSNTHLDMLDNGTVTFYNSD